MIRRRDFLAHSLISLALTGCSRRDHSPVTETPPVATKLPEMPPPDAPLSARGQVGTQTWTFDGGGRAVVVVPESIIIVS